jgi:hypothetical protein
MGIRSEVSGTAVFKELRNDSRELDECVGLKATVETRVTQPERRLFGQAASSPRAKPQ